MQHRTQQFVIDITPLIDNQEQAIDLIVGVINNYYNLLVRTYKDLCYYYINHRIYAQDGYTILIVDVTTEKTNWGIIRSLAYSMVFGDAVLFGPSTNTIEHLGETIVRGLLDYPALINYEPAQFLTELETLKKG